MLRGPIQPVGTKGYVASCHCGALRVEFRQRPRRIVECNCSICRRYGARWSYTHLAAVRVIGRRHEAAYRCGSKAIAFKRCRRCGCVVYYQRRQPNVDGRVRVGINTCMLPAADLEGIRVRRLDGAGSWAYLD